MNLTQAQTTTIQNSDNIIISTKLHPGEVAVIYETEPDYNFSIQAFADAETYGAIPYTKHFHNHTRIIKN